MRDLGQQGHKDGVLAAKLILEELYAASHLGYGCVVLNLHVCRVVACLLSA